MCLTMSRSWRNAGPWLRHQRHWDVSFLLIAVEELLRLPHIKWVTWLSENWCKLWVDTLDTNTSKEHLQVSIVSIFRSCAWRVWPEACVWSSCKLASHILTFWHGPTGDMFVCLPPLLFLRLWLRFKWLRLWRRPWRLGHGIRIANDAWSVPFSEFPATVPSNYWSQQLTAQHCFTVSCNGVVGWAFVKSL